MKKMASVKAGSVKADEEATETAAEQDERSETQKKKDWAVAAGFTEQQAQFLATHFGWDE